MTIFIFPNPSVFRFYVTPGSMDSKNVLDGRSLLKNGRSDLLRTVTGEMQPGEVGAGGLTDIARTISSGEGTIDVAFLEDDVKGPVEFQSALCEIDPDIYPPVKWGNKDLESGEINTSMVAQSSPGKYIHLQIFRYGKLDRCAS